jgi:hypothetical protein
VLCILWKSQMPIPHHRVLFTLARQIYTAHPSITVRDWITQTLALLEKQGWNKPTPHALRQALRAVAIAAGRKTTQQPRPIPAAPAVTQRSQPRPIGLRALWVVARDEIERDPLLDNFDWTENIKRRLVRDGYDYPAPDVLAAMLERIERALTKRWGPRPLPGHRPQPQPQGKPDGSPWHIPRDPQPSAPFTPAIGEQGQLVEALDRYAPEALAAVRRAAQSPAVKASIARARQRTADERAQPQPPSRMVLLQMQRALLLAQDARAKRRTLERAPDEAGQTPNAEDERKTEHAKATDEDGTTDTRS